MLCLNAISERMFEDVKWYSSVKWTGGAVRWCSSIVIVSTASKVRFEELFFLGRKVHNGNMVRGRVECGSVMATVYDKSYVNFIRL